jgi:hypothetical protein
MTHVFKIDSRASTLPSGALFALALAACSRPQRADDSGARRPSAAEASVDVASSPVMDASVEDAAPEDTGAGPRRVVVTSTGSVVLHRHVVQMAQSYREMGGLSYMLTRIAPIITPREIAIVPLEGPLTTSSRPPWVGDNPALGGHPWMARQLARVGFDAVILATNHALDQRPDGLESTIESLDQATLGAIGAGRSEEDAYTPWTTERDGVRVAVLGYTDRSAFAPGGADARAFVAKDLSRVLEAVRAARNAADIVVVCAHWGRDRNPNANSNQRSLARRFVDAGADLVLGAGPAVLQSVERLTSDRGDAVVAFSLGSLLSNFGSAWHNGVEERPLSDPMGVMYDPKTRDGALLRVQLEVPEPGRVTLVSISAVATWTVNFTSDLHVVPMRHADDRISRARLRAITNALGQAVRVRP